MLDTLQQSFLNAIIDPRQEATLKTYIKPSKIDSEHLISIYRNNVFMNLTEALKITYPGIWRLLGEECAKAAAYKTFCQIENLPKNGNIEEWGEMFPEVLSKYESLNDLVYLKDYGSLEWLKHLSYCAADAQELDITQLSQLSEKDLNRAKFVFHPSCYLLESAYPLDLIADLVENSVDKEVCLDSRNSYAVVIRNNGSVKTLWLFEDYWQFINLLYAGDSLGGVSDIMAQRYTDFNLAATLSFVLSNKLVMDYIL